VQGHFFAMKASPAIKPRVRQWPRHARVAGRGSGRTGGHTATRSGRRVRELRVARGTSRGGAAHGPMVASLPRCAYGAERRARALWSAGTWWRSATSRSDVIQSDCHCLTANNFENSN
jgi:hypothetical protein